MGLKYFFSFEFTGTIKHCQLTDSDFIFKKICFVSIAYKCYWLIIIVAMINNDQDDDHSHHFDDQLKTW